MANQPDLKIKGRLVFRPDHGDAEHDLGEVEFALALRPQLATRRGAPLPTGPTAPSGISPARGTVIGGVTIGDFPNSMPVVTRNAASDGMTVDHYNGR